MMTRSETSGGRKYRSFEVAEDRSSPGDWRVESIDFDGEGECLSVIFLGNGAEELAREYAGWKDGQRIDSPAARDQS
jgi:hypothetical protein